MTLAELLASKGIAKEVIDGLPKDVIGHVQGFVSEADTKLQTATKEHTDAEEARRQAELERKEIDTYVNEYGTSLTKMASVEASNEAMRTYLKKMKEGGYSVPDEFLAAPDPTKKPIVPGSPAVGGNVDEGKILGKVGNFMSQWLDANNEHIRLYGTPIPDGSEALAAEAQRARKPLGQFAAEKYGFEKKRQEKVAADTAAREAAIRKDEREKLEREHAEKNGSNSNLRPGESSREPFIPKIKSEEFHKSDGPRSTRDRLARVKERVHADVNAARGAA